MNGKEIIEIIQKNNLENEDIGILGHTYNGEPIHKKIEGIIRCDNYYNYCCFATKTEYDTEHDSCKLKK